MPLTTDQATFVEGVSQQTKIDPRVVVAWLEIEGADAAGGTGHYNYLNLRPYPGDPYAAVSSGGFEQFANVQDAVAATTRRLRQPFAAPIVQGDTRRTPRQEIAAIAGTGWDAGHYGGDGSALANKFASIFKPAALDDRYLGPENAAAVASTAGTGSADIPGGLIGAVGGPVLPKPPGIPNPLSGLEALAGAIGRFVDWITNPDNWKRLGIAALGLALVVVGAREALA